MGIKSLFKHLLLTIVVLSMYACGGGGESSHKTIIEVQKQQSTNLVFADQKLTDCVQALIDSEGYTLIEQITELTCIGKEIADIEGIQNLSFLEILNLSQNQIRDITPISKLGRLKQLYLQGNNLQLLSPIAKNQLLEQVDISDNDAIICSEKDQLEAKLDDKLISEAICLDQMQQAETATFEDTNLQICIRQTAQEIGAQHLEQIQQLKCVNRDISNIDGIELLANLRELDLTQNNISDITPLQGLALLKKVLLGNNQISNIQPLTASQYMQELRLDYNQLADIQGVETLDALRQIHLTNNDIRDLTPLQSLTELLELRISNNRIIDIQALANIPKLTSLWIQGNQIADLAPLQSLQHLEQLWLSNNWLTDLTPLQTQSKLKWLHLDGTEVADLNPLNKLTQLKWLQLDNTAVVDITAIYPLTKLDWLHLKGNNTIPCSQLDHMEEILTPEKIDRPETCSQPQEQSGNPISTIEFQDQALRDCVYDAAREQGITNAEELTTLSCPEAGIADITELTQFPGITNVDLTGNDHISCTQLDQLQGSIGENALIRPEQCNLPPIVAAQQEQTVETGTQVDLNAEATDPNGDTLTYSWQQTAGQSIQLTNQNTATPSFTAPQGEDQTITFQLTVTDQYGLSATQAINILVTGAILGSKDNPFLVTNYADLKKVGTGIDGWNLDSHYLQTADIDATPSKTENPIPEAEEEYYGFQPIGNGETPFTGGYDGGGFEIDDLTINRPDQSQIGLFGYAFNASFSDINLSSVDINGGSIIGGLTGMFSADDSTDVNFKNIFVSGNLSGYHVFGGVFGQVTSNQGSSLIIENVHADVNISTGSDDMFYVVGGVAGLLSGYNINIVKSSSTVVFSDSFLNDEVGGLVGQFSGYNLSVKDSNSEVYMIGFGEPENVGGLVGLFSGSDLTLSNSYSDGELEGYGALAWNIGGLIGRLESDDGRVELINNHSSWNIGISNTDSSFIGGLVGWLSGNDIVLLDSYAENEITLDGRYHQAIGGLTGSIYGENIDLTNSYSTGNINISNEGGVQRVGGLVGDIGGGDINVSRVFASGNVTTIYADDCLENVTEVCGYLIGGLIGRAGGKVDITQAYATGNVFGEYQVGGLIGSQQGEIAMSNSYARGNVTGNSQVGGLVGQISHSDGGDENPATYSSITNSYSTGQVLLQNEELEPIDFGGLVGASTSELNTVSNSFWDIETSGQETSVGGTPKTSEELKNTTTFTNVGWDFDQTWMILSDGYTYPRLAFNTVEVASWTDLNNMRNNMHANYVQTRDLLTTDADYAELAGADANDGEGWEPVGTDANPFRGMFDGDGFTIDGLTIDRPEENYVGIFGVAKNSDFDGINLRDVSVTGYSLVGSLAGHLLNDNGSITIANTSVTGNVSGEDQYVGGIAGILSGKNLSIANSDFDGEIVGRYFVGGLAGEIVGDKADKALISNSHSAGSINWTGYEAHYIGGLAGMMAGGSGYSVKIYDSYSTIDITITEDSYLIGGLVGQVGSDTAEVVNTYASGDIKISGLAVNVGGLFGWFAGQNRVYLRNCYALGDINIELGKQQGWGLNIGGLTGDSIGVHDVEDCFATGNITMPDSRGHVGGLFGILSGRGTIRQTYATGNIIAPGAGPAGGLVGTSNVSIDNSYAEGNVLVGGNPEITSKMAGGLVGVLAVDPELQIVPEIRNSYAIGLVVGDTDVGGLVGFLDGEIINSYALGDVTGNERTGGLVGQMGSYEGDDEIPDRYSSISNSYSSGLVQLENDDLDPVDFGGLVGVSDSELNIVSNSFWDIETSGQEISAGGTGLTTAEMQDQYTFESAGWDFYSVWGYNYGEYPFLLEQDDIARIEFESGQYNGTYAWDCGGGLSGSENITLDLTESYGVISGTADYLGGQTTITNGRFNEITGSISFGLPASATNVLNSFTGTYTPDDPMAKIVGATAWGDSPAGEGCQSSFGAAGTMSLY